MILQIFGNLIEVNSRNIHSYVCDLLSILYSLDLEFVVSVAKKPYIDLASTLHGCYDIYVSDYILSLSTLNEGASASDKLLDVAVMTSGKGHKNESFCKFKLKPSIERQLRKELIKELTRMYLHFPEQFLSNARAECVRYKRRIELEKVIANLTYSIQIAEDELVKVKNKKGMIERYNSLKSEVALLQKTRKGVRIEF